MCQTRLKLSWKVYECKPLRGGGAPRGERQADGGGGCGEEVNHRQSISQITLNLISVALLYPLSVVNFNTTVTL